MLHFTGEGFYRRNSVTSSSSSTRCPINYTEFRFSFISLRISELWYNAYFPLYSSSAQFDSCLRESCCFIDVSFSESLTWTHLYSRFLESRTFLTSGRCSMRPSWTARCCPDWSGPRQSTRREPNAPCFHITRWWLALNNVSNNFKHFQSLLFHSLKKLPRWVIQFLFRFKTIFINWGVILFAVTLRGALPFIRGDREQSLQQDNLRRLCHASLQSGASRKPLQHGRRLETTFSLW